MSSFDGKERPNGTQQQKKTQPNTPTQHTQSMMNERREPDKDDNENRRIKNITQSSN